MRDQACEHLCFCPIRLANVSEETISLDTEQRSVFTLRIVDKRAMDVELYLLFISMRWQVLNRWRRIIDSVVTSQ